MIIWLYESVYQSISQWTSQSVSQLINWWSPDDLGPVEESTDVVFDRVVTNIGGAYNVETGHFTSPVNATYQFNVVISAQGKQRVCKNYVIDTALLEWVSECAVGAYTSPKSAVSYLNHAQIAQTTSSFAELSVV